MAWVSGVQGQPGEEGGDEDPQRSRPGRMPCAEIDCSSRFGERMETEARRARMPRIRVFVVVGDQYEDGCSIVRQGWRPSAADLAPATLESSGGAVRRRSPSLSSVPVAGLSLSAPKRGQRRTSRAALRGSEAPRLAAEGQVARRHPSTPAPDLETRSRACRRHRFLLAFVGTASRRPNAPQPVRRRPPGPAPAQPRRRTDSAAVRCAAGAQDEPSDGIYRAPRTPGGRAGGGSGGGERAALFRGSQYLRPNGAADAKQAPRRVSENEAAGRRDKHTRRCERCRELKHEVPIGKTSWPGLEATGGAHSKREGLSLALFNFAAPGS